MKSLITLMFLLILMQSINAQQKTKDLNYYKKAFPIKTDQNINVFSWLDFEMLPQFNGLFTKAFNACKNKIEWKDIYNDYDFGFNIGFNVNIIERLKFKTLYNIGVIKFNNSRQILADAYSVKLSITYIF